MRSKIHSNMLALLLVAFVIILYLLFFKALMSYDDSGVSSKDKSDPVVTITEYTGNNYLYEFIEVDASITSVEGEYIFVLNDNIVCELCKCQNTESIHEGETLKVTGTVVACGKNLYLEGCKMTKETEVV